MLFTVRSLLAATAMVGVAGAAHTQLAPNQSGVAAAIATPVITSPNTVLVQTAIAGVPAGSLGSVYSQFTPAGYALLPDLTLQTAKFEETSIRQYLRDFRAGGTGVPGIAGQATPGDRKLGSFFIAGGQTGHYDADGDRVRTHYDSTSAIAGIDYRLGAKSLVGITGGYDRVEDRFDPYSKTSKIGSWFGGGYGTLGVGPLYVDLFGTYGETKYDLHRSIVIGGTSPTTISYGTGTGGRTWLGGATTGLSFNRFGFEFEPFVGARYADLRIDGFTDGPDVGALTLGRRTYKSVLGTAGLRIGQTVALPGGLSLRPQVTGSYRHEFDRYDFNSFTFGTGPAPITPVNFTPAGLARDYATVAAGITVSKATSPFSLVIDYTGEFARDRQINGITGGFRLTF